MHITDCFRNIYRNCNRCERMYSFSFSTNDGAYCPGNNNHRAYYGLSGIESSALRSRWIQFIFMDRRWKFKLHFSGSDRELYCDSNRWIRMHRKQFSDDYNFYCTECYNYGPVFSMRRTSGATLHSYRIYFL